MKKVLFAFMAVALVGSVAQAKRQPAFERAVVKVIVVAANPNYNQPWQSGQQQIQTGSGVVIEGGRVLTNGHVVANQTFVQVQRQGDPNKYTARVVLAGHECDLALLEVPDKNFLKGVRPIPIGKMPTVRDKVAAYGFPIGGDKLSITEGVVSRIEMGRYAHCWKRLPLAQIDAAINPGNSGGPVIMGDKIVGIAFQGLGMADNVGYMIPPPVIEHFLADAQDGKYDGFPGLGIGYQTLENPDQRRYLGMAAGQTGVMVEKVAFDSSAWDALHVGDVILSVDGQEVANDGTVPFLGEERIMFGYVLVKKFPGDTAKLSILRAGKPLDVTVTFKESTPVVSTCEFDRMPTYYIYGGMVFAPLTLNYIQASGGNNWWSHSPVDLRFHLIYDVAEPDKRQVVIMQYVLADEANVGYHDLEDLVVEKVNGQQVVDIKDLVNKIENANTDFIEIEAEDGTRVVLSAESAKQATARVLQRYRIPADRSDDLR